MTRTIVFSKQYYREDCIREVITELADSLTVNVISSDARSFVIAASDSSPSSSESSIREFANTLLQKSLITIVG